MTAPTSPPAAASAPAAGSPTSPVLEPPTPRRGPGPAGGQGARHGPGAFMGGMPTEKSLDFRGSSRRLLANMRPERLLIALTLALGAASVALSVLGPRILGQATDLIFSGVVSRRIPPGTTQAETVRNLRASGQGRLADMLASMHLVPGRGIDFGQVQRVLLIVAGVYVGASLASLLQGRLTATIVQRSVYRLRQQAQTKLARLPLSYFDRQPRGEVLSGSPTTWTTWPRRCSRPSARW